MSFKVTITNNETAAEDVISQLKTEPRVKLILELKAIISGKSN